MTSSFSVSPTSASSSFAPQQASNSDQSTGSGFGALLDAVGSIGNGIAGAIGKLTSPPAPAAQSGFKQIGAPTAAESAASTNAASAGGTDEDAAGTPPSLLHELVASLTELQNAVNSGKPVDPALVKKAKNAIDAVSNFLTVQQPSTVAAQAASTTPDSSASSTAGAAAAVGATAASAGAGAGTDGSSTGTDSAAADAAKSLLSQLDGKLQSFSAALSSTSPELAGKLDDLAKSLDPSKVSGDTLTQLGLAGTSSSQDPKLTAAINDFVHGTSQAASLQPSLGTPQLKLPPGDQTSTSTNSGKTSAPSQPAHGNAANELKTAVASTRSGSSPGDGSKGSSGQSASSAAAEAANAQAAQAQSATATPAADGSASSAAIAPQAAAAVNAATPAAQAAQSAYPPAAQINLPQMAYEIAHRAQSGSNSFEIKLDPAEMGRVDVKLAFDSSGAVSAKLTVERPETLALLQKDSGALGQALTQAGLDGSKTSLQFSLSQNPFAGQNGGNGNGRANSDSQAQAAEDDLTVDSAGASSVTNLYRGTVSASGLNIIV